MNYAVHSKLFKASNKEEEENSLTRILRPSKYFQNTYIMAKVCSIPCSKTFASNLE